jgi:L,D-peptidoglycan transpeptidase YkuD (ErfK/YbiS/YcfS/YnhG family)
MSLRSLDGAAEAVDTARRDVPVGPFQSCDLQTAEALGARYPLVGQFIIVRSGSWSTGDAIVDVAARDRDGVWRCQRGGQPARVGRNGLRPLHDRRSGDGTTPAGVFALGVTTAWDGQQFAFFGNQPDPGVRGNYRRVRSQDCWGATPGASSYNHLVNRAGCPGPDDEWLARFGDVYAHAAVIGANTEPDVSGDEPSELPYAAAIFLHRHSYTGTVARPTSGCVSLALEDLVTTLQLIDPERSTRFAIGETSWLRADA